MKYEALYDLGLMCEAGMKSLAFDLKGGYHTINLAPEIRKYVCFQVGGVYYHCKVLPFGMNIVPLVFVMVVRHLVHELCKCQFGRGMGCNVLHYVDNFFIVLWQD